MAYRNNCSEENDEDIRDIETYRVVSLELLREKNEESEKSL